jgi:glycerophosphoryl diester phosphodiesterase
MSAVWTITKGSTALSLLADPYYLADELPLGTVPRAFDILTGPTVDLPQIANYRTSDVRVLPWRCEVYGDDGQDLEDNLNALFDVLPRAGETATITIGRTDGTATAELELLAVSDLDAPYTYRRDMGRAAIVSCRLVCAPYATSATDTLYSAEAVSLPCVLDLSAMTGQHEAPLEFAAAGHLHQAVAGVYPDGAATIADFIHKAVDLSWSAGVADIDANGYTTDVGYTHKVADATTIAAPDGSDDATDRALANELKSDLNTHMASTTYHLAADTAISTADATDDATFIALTQALDVKWKAHAASTTVHGGIADDVALAAVTALALAASPDKAACRTYCNALKPIHAAHLLATTDVGHAVWKTNSASAVYADIDVTSYEPGTYAVYANARRDTAASPAQVYTAYTDEVDIEGTDLRRHLLGYVSLPCETVRGSATSSLRVYLISDGTDYVYLNTIELIPASWGIAGWHHGTTTETVAELRWDDGIVYADDAASLAYAIGDRELSVLDGALVVTGESDAEAATIATALSVSYDPRWEQLPATDPNTPNVDALSLPTIAAHRGGAAIHPENTLEGFTLALAGHVPVLELDVYKLTDGSLGVMHDSTVDRTTSGTGNVADLDEAGFTALTVDCSSWFLASWADTHPPMLEDVFTAYGKSVVYLVEGKNSTSPGAIAALAVAHGLRDYVVVQAFNSGSCAEAHPYGVQSMFLTDVDNAAVNAAAGHSWVGGSTSVTDAYITNAKAAGLKVAIYGVTRHDNRDTWYAKGVDMVMSDDPCYLTEEHIDLRADGTGLYIADPYAEKTYWHGQLADNSDRGQWSGDDYWGMPAKVATSYDGCLQGWGSPVPWAVGSYSITFTIKFTTSPSSSWWASCFCCSPNDKSFTDSAKAGSNGYHILISAGGRLRVFRVDNGAATQLGSNVDTGIIAEGGTATMRIDVTPTSITATRTDVGSPNTLTVADANYRGGYFHFGKNGDASVFDFKDVVVRPA